MLDDPTWLNRSVISAERSGTNGQSFLQREMTGMDTSTTLSYCGGPSAKFSVLSNHRVHQSVLTPGLHVVARDITALSCLILFGNRIGWTTLISDDYLPTSRLHNRGTTVIMSLRFWASMNRHAMRPRFGPAFAIQRSKHPTNQTNSHPSRLACSSVPMTEKTSPKNLAHLSFPKHLMCTRHVCAQVILHSRVYRPRLCHQNLEALD